MTPGTNTPIFVFQVAVAGVIILRLLLEVQFDVRYKLHGS